MNAISKASPLPSTSSLPEWIARLLPDLLEQQRWLEGTRVASTRTDGVIVGTGKADFTTSNVIYNFKYAGHEFQLVDVPGIEGNEEKYAEMVREALAKAHVVFYVNGTNKKPEAETAEKIGRYLRHDAVVHPICNIRGKGDTYEFPEDRHSLANTHRDIGTNLQLTEGVLHQKIGRDVVRQAVVVQGMAALSSVAWVDGSTTLVSDRTDLVKSQAGLLGLFEKPEILRRFSQVDQLHELLVGYAEGGFQKEIAAANRRKVVRRLRETLDELERNISVHGEKSQALSNSIKTSVESIKKLLDKFEGDLRRRIHVTTEGVFEGLASKVCSIIEEKFRSRSDAQKCVEDEARKAMNGLLLNIDGIVDGVLTAFHERLTEELKRMREDIDALRSALPKLQYDGFGLSLGSALNSIDFHWGDAGSLLLKIGSYALAGAGIAGPPTAGVMAPIGAAIGALIGASVQALMYLGFGRDKKIRKAQSDAIQLLNKNKVEILSQVDENIYMQSAELRSIVTSKMLSPLQDQVVSMGRAGQVLAEQRVRVFNIYEEVREPLNESF